MFITQQHKSMPILPKEKENTGKSPRNGDPRKNFFQKIHDKYEATFTPPRSARQCKEDKANRLKKSMRA